MRECDYTIYKLKTKHNIPDGYLTVENITLLINYINAGRAIDVTGAINQIKHDADQQQLLRAQQQAAEYNRQLAMQAKRNTDASAEVARLQEQANADFWLARAMKKNQTE